MKKSRTYALLISLTFGWAGLDRFYLGHSGIGVLKLLTGGCFGILWLIDIVRIANGSLKPADGEYDESVLFTGTAGAGSANTDPYDALERLDKLHTSGSLSDAEYEEMKRECLSRI